MFNTTAELATRMRTAGGAGLQEIVIHWPNDDQWIARSSERRIYQRQLGRGKSTVDVEPGSSDLGIYNAVRVNGSPDLTPGEATMLFNTVAQCECVGVELNATSAIVTLRVMGGAEVKHMLKIPTADQVLKAQKEASKSTILPHGLWATKTHMNVWLKLWSDCQGASVDYDGPIPAIHREQAIREVVQALEQEMAGGVDETPI